MIDGLRGIAAFSVLVFHVLWNSAGSDSLRGLLTTEGQWMTGLLRSGVAVFFVISGFVIAHTTRNVRTFDQSWRFGAKRQLRLDPPYYAAMGVVLVIEAIQLLIPGLVGRSFTVAEVALNMLYLQNIVGAPSVLAVAWTLCLEVQFYLVIILVAWTAARIARSEQTRTLLVVGGGSTLTAVSLSLPFIGVDAGPWVIGLWWMFGLGMSIAWVTDGHAPRWIAAATIGTAALAAVAARLFAGVGDPWGGDWVALATAVVVLYWASSGRLTRSPGRILLWAGRISYSLYLIHLPVIEITTGVALKVLPDSPIARAGAAIASAVLAVLAAEALYRAVERRSLAWARRVPSSRRDDAEPLRA